MKKTLSVVILAAFAGATLAAFSNVAQAQRMDFAFGISTVDSPGASSVSPTDTSHSPVSITGGAYPGFSGNVLFYHNAGVGAEIYWKGSQVAYAGQPFDYRPVLWNVNAVYSPKLASHAYLELVGGIGALSTRFYTGTTCGIYSCSNYQSINHFDGDFGGGIKLYAGHNFFVRPEARFYLINNNQEFSSNHTTRYGVSIGYTFR